MDKDTLINDGFKNIKLFVSDVALSVETDDVNAWFIDFGASLHMSCNKDWFDEYHENINGTSVYVGDNKPLQVQGYGIIGVMLRNGKERQSHDVMHVLGIKRNVIYVSTISNQVLKAEFVKSQCIVKDIQDRYKVISNSYQSWRVV